jgi:hypothetical protein
MVGFIREKKRYMEWDEYQALVSFLSNFNFSQMAYKQSVKNI